MKKEKPSIVVTLNVERSEQVSQEWPTEEEIKACEFIGNLIGSGQMKDKDFEKGLKLAKRTLRSGGDIIDLTDSS